MPRPGPLSLGLKHATPMTTGGLLFHHSPWGKTCSARLVSSVNESTDDFYKIEKHCATASAAVQSPNECWL